MLQDIGILYFVERLRTYQIILFCAFKHETDDSVAMYEDQKDGNFVMIGLYTYSKAMKLMNKMKVR